MRVRHQGWARSGVLAVALTLSCPSAFANGRYPATNSFVFSQKDPDQWILRVTFGLLVSRDHGKSWDWVCERALGIVGEEDPMYAVMPSGAIITSTFRGVGVTRDGMCSFPLVAALGSRAFVDLTARAAAANEVIVFASPRVGDAADGTPLFESELLETTDDARTFSSLGSPFPDRSFAGETVDIAPSDRERLYVTGVKNKGLETPTARLFISRDRGKTWTDIAVPLEGSEKAVFIAGVDPLSADRVYLRTSNGFELPTRLIVSEDGGKTIRTIFTAKSALAGFATSPDGKRVWVGSSLDGLHAASTTDFVFAQRSKIEIQCLAASPDGGLLACSNERHGFVAGKSSDDGVTFEPVLRFCNIRGPLQGCAPESATQFECSAGGRLAQPPWPFQRLQLACDLPDGGGRRTPPSPATPPPSDVSADEGCAAVPANSSPGSCATLGGLAALVLVWLRRTRAR